MSDDAERPAHQFQPGNTAGAEGRPTGFRDEFVEQARKLAQLGAIDTEIADFFEIGIRTLYRWRIAYPEFAEALQTGKEAADDRVESSLFRKATGYTFASEKIFCQEGQVIRAETVEHVPPSDTACIFWLKNRRKADWRDKVEHEHAGVVKHEVSIDEYRALERLSSTRPSDEALRLARQVEANESLYWFTRYGFLQQRGYRWQRNWHHDLICDKLQDVYEGRCRRLIINIPPRYGKTEIAVVNFIAWALGKAPDSEFIHASYGARLAANNTTRARDLVRAEWYHDLFPDLALNPDKQANDDWRTTEGGVVYAAGAGGTITGFGAGKKRPGFGGAIIVDDPHKPSEATSDLMRENVIDWFKNTLESRRNSPETPIIVIMQRLHEEDLAGWLLGGGNGETWEHLNIPALNDPPVSFWPDDAPEALWPTTHTLDDLRRMEKAKPYEFAGQYMQRPAPIGGGIFKLEWWKHFRLDALPPIKRIVQSWDTAFKAKTTNDYSVCTTWAECEHGYYLLHVWKQRVEFPELKRIVVSLAAKYQAHAILVEDKASGQSLLQEMQRDTKLPMIPIKVDTDKLSRAFAVTPLIQAGRVFLPEGAAWVADYMASLGAFPNAAHDDDVDSTTQALNYLSHGGGGHKFVFA